MGHGGATHKNKITHQLEKGCLNLYAHITCKGSSVVGIHYFFDRRLQVSLSANQNVTAASLGLVFRCLLLAITLEGWEFKCGGRALICPPILRINALPLWAMTNRFLQNTLANNTQRSQDIRVKPVQLTWVVFSPRG